MLSLRLGIECFVRIAACAALLTTSLLGQWLHHLDHHLSHQKCSNSANFPQPPHCYTCQCEHSNKISHSNDNKFPEHEHDSPAVPHDHGSCSICYVISQAVSNPVLTAGLTVSEPLFQQLQTESEFAAPASCCTPIARGPPAGLPGRC